MQDILAFPIYYKLGRLPFTFVNRANFRINQSSVYEKPVGVQTIFDTT